MNIEIKYAVLDKESGEFQYRIANANVHLYSDYVYVQLDHCGPIVHMMIHGKFTDGEDIIKPWCNNIRTYKNEFEIYDWKLSMQHENDLFNAAIGKDQHDFIGLLPSKLSQKTQEQLKIIFPYDTKPNFRHQWLCMNHDEKMSTLRTLGRYVHGSVSSSGINAPFYKSFGYTCMLCMNNIKDCVNDHNNYRLLVEFKD